MLLVVPAVAMAQHGVIGLFADQTATSCEMVDSGQGILDIYVMHTLVTGSTASQFMVQPSAGFTAMHIGDTTPYLYIGNSQTGISVAYGECLTAPIHIMTITYLFDGTSSACGFLEIVGDPNAPQPPGLYTVDCAPEWEMQKHVPQGGKLFVNGDGSCPCMSPVPAQESTWGEIKALYN
jgi:hypothetical protein